jgi:hypothetical protein
MDCISDAAMVQYKYQKTSWQLKKYTIILFILTQLVDRLSGVLS